jgi:DNA invertase Pin-like site-specific DNA recombinase
MQGGSRKGSGRKPIEIDERRAFSLFDQGFSKLEIANRFGVNYNSMRTIFRKAGKFKPSSKRKPDGI